jgi:hypothetical protein
VAAVWRRVSATAPSLRISPSLSGTKPPNTVPSTPRCWNTPRRSTTSGAVDADSYAAIQVIGEPQFAHLFVVPRSSRMMDEIVLLAEAPEGGLQLVGHAVSRRGSSTMSPREIPQSFRGPGRDPPPPIAG